MISSLPPIDHIARRSVLPNKRLAPANNYVAASTNGGNSMFWFDPMYFVFVAPAFILALWAQYRVRAGTSAIGAADGCRRGPAYSRSGRTSDVGIEMIPGNLSDHYDPREKVLRLPGRV